MDELKQKIQNLRNSQDNTTHPIDPLFNSMDEYEKFKERHEKAKVPRKDLDSFEGDCFIGIDAGSTTTKLVLTDNEDNLLYSLYANNEGNPLKSVMKMLKELYSVLPSKAKIRFSGVTGYGEKLIQTALNVDLNEKQSRIIQLPKNSNQMLQV